MLELFTQVESRFNGDSLKLYAGEYTLVLRNSQNYLKALSTLRDEFGFEMLVDLCGVDFLTQAKMLDGENLPRFAVVVHLLSIKHNQRLRVRVYLEDEEMPMLPSVTQIYPSANWYEREAFDLYGILFNDHEDLRRILTDYGFIGYPFRKDFPISGYVETKYDEAQKRVVYCAVSIPPREITPRTVRESGYAGIKG